MLALPALLVLVPRGAAPLAAFAGLCSLALMLARPSSTRLPALGWPAAILVALVAWGAVSAAWSLNPGRSLALALHLAGLFVAAVVMGGAAARIAAPWRFAVCLLGGTAIGIIVAGIDFTTAGGLSEFVSIRAFAAPRFNQFSAWLAILLLPSVALLANRGRWLLAACAAAAMGGAVFMLQGTTAKAALLLGLPVAALLCLWPRIVARSLVVLSAVAIMTAPLTLPRLDSLPNVFITAFHYKVSAGHRLEIWSFVGDRIAEHPVVGWGLDSSRAIPGGNVEIRPGESRLPLHPHNAALQVWLELGVPGALLFAGLTSLLWLRLAEMPWPRLYTAAAGGSFASALAVAFAGWGIWQEWWLGTLSLALFVIMTMARASRPAA